MSDLSAFAEKLRRMSRGVERGLRRGLRRTADEACRNACAFCPVQTGALRASISVKVENDGFELAASAPYVAFVEQKTPFLKTAMAENEFMQMMLRSIGKEM